MCRAYKNKLDACAREQWSVGVRKPNQFTAWCWLWLLRGWFILFVQPVVQRELKAQEELEEVWDLSVYGWRDWYERGGGLLVQSVLGIAEKFQ